MTDHQTNDDTDDDPIAAAESKPMEDYRLSHQDRGPRYRALYRTNPYAMLLWTQEQAILLDILKRYPDTPRTHYLDFACGTGRIVAHMAPHFQHSVGVDVSESMLTEARDATAGAQLVHGDLTRDKTLLPGPFDVITAFRFFLNAQADLRVSVMEALAGRMHARSLLVFNNHRNRGSLTYRLLRLRGRTEDQIRTMPHDDVTDLVRSAGLEIARIYHVGVIPATEDRLLLPVPVMRAAEGLLRRVPGLSLVANDVIYVCRRARA